MEKQICKNCKKELSIECFQLFTFKYTPVTDKPSKSNGRRKQCIKCNNDKHTNKYVRNNKERVLNKMKDYQCSIRLASTDVYICGLIRGEFGIKTAQITKEMIDLKRKSNGIQREIK
jgi:hypothetical protein